MDHNNHPLAFTLENRAERDDRVTLASFGVAAAGLADLIRRVTLEQSGAKMAVEWVIDDLSMGSASLSLATIPRTKDAERVEHDASRLVAEGLERIERGEEPDEVFSAEAAEAAREIVRVLSNGIGRVIVRNYGHRVELTREGAGRVVAPLGRFSSLGSVEGKLKTLSFSSDRPYFSVFRSQDDRAVRCYFEERRYIDEVVEMLKRRERIIVSGRVARRPNGVPYAVTEIRNIQRLRSRSELPSVDDILGIDPDLTEGLSGEEWLRRQRA